MAGFNVARLALARRRRGVSKKRLAELADLAPRTVLRVEQGTFEPTELTVASIAHALGFPVTFFYGEDVSELTAEGATFRALSAATVTQREAVLAMGAIAFLVDDVLTHRLRMPESALPDLREDTPEAAAEALRRAWGLGDAPIQNAVHLLEAKGVRVYSLATDCSEIDAFATWRAGKPYVFLSMMKGGERGRFDACHELAHLVLHRAADRDRVSERDADAFASAFLMPRTSIVATAPRLVTVQTLVKLKHRWGVSVAALARRLSDLRLISEWEYRQLCIEIAARGWRRAEPEGIPRETSQLLRKAFATLRQVGVTLRDVAVEARLDPVDVNALTFGVSPVAMAGGLLTARRTDGLPPVR